MLFSPNTVLVVGLDNRPRPAPAPRSRAPTTTSGMPAPTRSCSGASAAACRDALSIPRDTLVDIPGYGNNKINAAWAYGGPSLALKTIKQFTGLKINHLIVVDLANFPKFIDDIGGVTVKTARICSEISGGRQNGGFTLNLQPGHPPPERPAGADAREDPRELVQPRLHRPQARGGTAADPQRHQIPAVQLPRLLQPALGRLGRARGDPDRHGQPVTAQLFLASEIGGSRPGHTCSRRRPSLLRRPVVLVPNTDNVQGQVRRLLHG